MHTAHVLMRYFPFIGLGFALGFMQVFVFLRRKRRKAQWYWGGIAAFWFLLVMLWIFFRGDKHSDDWVRSWFGRVDSALQLPVSGG